MPSQFILLLDSTSTVIETRDAHEEIENYEIWKDRILKEAYKALGMKQT